MGGAIQTEGAQQRISAVVVPGRREVRVAPALVPTLGEHRGASRRLRTRERETPVRAIPSRLNRGRLAPTREGGDTVTPDVRPASNAVMADGRAGAHAALVRVRSPGEGKAASSAL